MLSAIGMTIILESYTIHDPLKQHDGKFILKIQYLLQSYSKNNLPVLLELAVPVKLIQVGHIHLHNKLPKFRRIAQLLIIAFYYLLRVGEYTKLRKKTRTV